MDGHVEINGRRIAIAGLDTEGGLLFEPRAFWSAGSIAIDAEEMAIGAPQVIAFPRRDFRNGARYPIVLTRLSILPHNYALADYDPADAEGTAYQAAMSAIHAAKIRISAPFRQDYTRASRQILTGYAPRPTTGPLMQALVTPAPLYASSMFGVSRLRFDKPLLLANKAAVRFDLSSPTIANAIAPAISTGSQINTRVTWHEEDPDSFFGGAARSKQVNLGWAALPYWRSSDAFGFNAGPVVTEFDIQQSFRAMDFLKQNPIRAGVARVREVSVYIDQIDYDDAVQSSALPQVPGSPVAELCARIPCRARTEIGGTGEWWWRPGAPLALVLTDQTPALVYDLPKPIVLSPGDALDIDIEVPGPVLLDTDPDVIATPIYQFSAAVSGFAVIEG